MLLDEGPDLAESGISDLYTVRIRGADRAVIGVLALAGWKGPEFSLRRRSRVGRYLATHIETVLERSFDSLTGLPAWPVFEKLLAAAVAAGSGEPPALMYLDIDRLHVANDTLGREVGDKVLASFAAILREELQGHAVTRIASDRFAALLMDTDLDEARRLAESISARFRRLEFSQGDLSFGASVSIGIGRAAMDSSLPADGDGPVDGGALATAQVACSAAKDRGRGRVEVYEPADLSIVQRFDDIQLVGYIRNAIDRGRLALMGQPIVTIRPGGRRARPRLFRGPGPAAGRGRPARFAVGVPVRGRALPDDGGAGSLGRRQHAVPARPVRRRPVECPGPVCHQSLRPEPGQRALPRLRAGAARAQRSAARNGVLRDHRDGGRREPAAGPDLHAHAAPIRVPVLPR